MARGHAATSLVPRLALALGLLLAATVPSESVAADSQLGIDRDGPTVRLSLSGDDGKEYSLEAVEQFLNAGAVWKPVATVAPAATKPVVLLDPTCSIRPQNFYRLRLLQGAVPVEVPNFRLLDIEGAAHELFYQSDARAVVLLVAGTDLQSLSGSAADIRSLHELWSAKGVRFYVIGIGDDASRAAWKQKAAELKLTFPLLLDDGGAVTRALASTAVPEVIVLNPSFWSIAYRGRISDSVEGAAGATKQALLADALGQLMDGRRVSVSRTAVEGAAPDLPAHSGGTYAQDIAPLLQRNCVRCHSPGNIAPWAMTNYAVIRDYAVSIRDEVLTRRMPPWHADRQPQRYSNDEMLTGADLGKLVDWVDRGAPRGDGGDPLAENPPPVPADWPLGTPDRVLPIETQNIPATGTVDYRYVLLPNPYPTNVWLKAAVVKPGNRRVLHHILVFSATSFADIEEIRGGLGGYFAAYVPGMEQVPFPPGTGKLLKRGAFLVFQIHYTATGKPETDRTELGLYLSPTPPARELRTGAAYTTSFTIPPNTADHPATAEFTLPRDAVVYEMSPHMHYRGSRFRFDAILPDNRRETLLNVPFYRFDWQTLYRLAEPKRLPAGTRIVVEGAWDNSAKNPFNPDPAASVSFGEQSWEEMLIGYFNWADAP